MATKEKYPSTSYRMLKGLMLHAKLRRIEHILNTSYTEILIANLVDFRSRKATDNTKCVCRIPGLRVSNRMPNNN